MNGVPAHLRETLKAIEAGNLVALTPEQVTELEHALNQNPGAAARLAHRVPTPEAPLRQALDEIAQRAAPTAASWETVWRHIDAAGTSGSCVVRPRALGRLLRMWQPLVAVAACLILAVVWRTTVRSTASDTWPLQLASDVEINELEVYGGGTGMILSLGDTNGPEVIWVFADDAAG